MAESSNSPSSAALVARRPGDIWSCTDVSQTKVSHRWNINNFSMVCRAKMNVESCRFTGGLADWHLTLYTCIYNGPVKQVQLSLFLDKLPTELPVSVECKASVLDDQKKRHCEETTFAQSAQKLGSICCVYVIERDQLLISQAEELLVGDRLTILCELRILLPQFKHTVMLPPVTPPSNNLIADLGSLLEGGLHSDVTLVAGGKEFPAHMNILSARSPVFEAMFQHDMREREEKKVAISDLSADTVQEMLQHIYTGEVSTLEQSTESLLEAADKYDLPSLKSACEETLRSKLEVENAAKMLMLADKHHADQLKAECMGVIIGHPQEVQESEDWDDVNKRQDLLAEVARVLLKQQQQIV